MVAANGNVVLLPPKEANSVPPNPLDGFELPFRGGERDGKVKEGRGTERKVQDGRNGRKTALISSVQLLAHWRT